MGDRVPPVSPWAEADLAVALGADPDAAAGAVAALRDADLLQHGVLVAATVAAARWGCLAVDAVAHLAAGRRLHGAVSDYELRAAREEAEDELAELGPVRSRGAAWAAAGLGDAPVEASPHHLPAPRG